jgi:hypothetical protein
LAGGAHVAWLLAQHAPPDLQEECLPLLQDAVTRGDARPADLDQRRAALGLAPEAENRARLLAPPSS